MSNFKLGDYIRRRRKELGMRQSQLCEGICNVSTLSRLESGKQATERRISNALLQRLGVVPEQYTSLLDEESFTIEELRHEMADAAFLKDYTKLQKYIAEIERSSQIENPMVRRFIINCKAIINFDSKNDLTAIEILKNALTLSRPNFDERKIAKLLLSVDEVKIANNIANIYTKQEKWDEAFNIYQQLIENLDAAYLDSEQRDRLLTMLSYNYSRALGLDKKYEQSLQIAQRGIDISLKTGRAIQLAQLYTNKAYCLYYLDRPSEADVFFKEAITMLKILKITDVALQVETQFKELFNVSID